MGDIALKVQAIHVSMDRIGPWNDRTEERWVSSNDDACTQSMLVAADPAPESHFRTRAVLSNRVDTVTPSVRRDCQGELAKGGRVSRLCCAAYMLGVLLR